MKIEDLTNEQLNYWCAKAQGWQYFWSKHNYYVVTDPQGDRSLYFEGWTEYDPDTGAKNNKPKPWQCFTEYHPSTDWDQAGELAEKYKVDIEWNLKEGVFANIWDESGGELLTMEADTPQRAICLAVIASVYGEEIDDE